MSRLSPYSIRTRTPSHTGKGDSVAATAYLDYKIVNMQKKKEVLVWRVRPPLFLYSCEGRIPSRYQAG